MLNYCLKLSGVLSLLFLLLAVKTKAQQIVKVPAFFMADSLQDKDTTYVMVFYYKHPARTRNTATDSSFEALPPHRADTLQRKWKDFTEVKFVSVFKKYIDYKHYYRTDDGHEAPLPVSTIVQRYERLGSSKWLFMDYPRKIFREMKEQTADVVRTEKAKAPNGQQITYEYYKLVEMP